MIELSRRDYAQMYGPTTGDRVRLGDTSLLIEVEKDLTVYGDEAKFGGGKSLRDGMGQSCAHTDEECLDTVITNALIVDCTGIYKADVGIKDGKISGIGKSGNPHIMDGVTPGMIVGASTEAIAGEGLILTAGGIDSHIHFIFPCRNNRCHKFRKRCTNRYYGQAYQCLAHSQFNCNTAGSIYCKISTNCNRYGTAYDK